MSLMATFLTNSAVEDCANAGVANRTHAATAVMVRFILVPPRSFAALNCRRVENPEKSLPVPVSVLHDLIRPQHPPWKRPQRQRKPGRSAAREHKASARRSRDVGTDCSGETG